MAHIRPFDRYELRSSSLESNIAPENVVRFIDAFVEHLDLSELAFFVSELKTEGRPSFGSEMFLKLYIYGYLNGIRSSRKLETETHRNIELHWLLGDLHPNYHSIADFRKDNPKALRNTFKLFVLFLKNCDLIGGELVAIDGTKFRASNSRKSNYNEKKIDRHLAYINKKTDEYLAQLLINDQLELPPQIKDIPQKIERLKSNKLKYEVLKQSLIGSGAPQISTTDSDARALLIQGQVVEIAYNQQASVDSKHKLVVATHTINRNDRNAMSAIAKETKSNLDSSDLTVLLDKGYHNGKQLQETQQAGIKTIVAIPEVVNSNEKGTQPEYMVSKFEYDKSSDSYTCPQGQKLETKGTWHQKKRGNKVSYQFKKYRSPCCLSCPVQHLCTGKQDGRREIERSVYAESVEQNAENYGNNGQLYR